MGDAKRGAGAPVFMCASRRMAQSSLSLSTMDAALIRLASPLLPSTGRPRALDEEDCEQAKANEARGGLVQIAPPVLVLTLLKLQSGVELHEQLHA